MPVRSLARRVERVRGATATTMTTISRIVIISPADWPEQEQLAYEAAQAKRDWRTQTDVVERMTGEGPALPATGWRPGLRPAVIEISTRPDGRQ